MTVENKNGLDALRHAVGQDAQTATLNHVKREVEAMRQEFSLNSRRQGNIPQYIFYSYLMLIAVLRFAYFFLCC